MEANYSNAWVIPRILSGRKSWETIASGDEMVGCLCSTIKITNELRDDKNCRMEESPLTIVYGLELV